MKGIISSANSISNTSKIEVQRSHFKQLSAHLIKAIKLFGVDQKYMKNFANWPMIVREHIGYAFQKKLKNPTSVKPCAIAGKLNLP